MEVPIKKHRRSLLQLALVAAFVFLAAPLLLAAVLRSPALREYARQQAQLAIQTELGLSAVIGDVDIEPSTLALIARNITLDHPSRGRFVEAKILRIRPSWWALLRGKVDLHTITIDKATVWLVFRDGKLINGPRTKPGGGGKTSVDLPFEKLFVKRSHLLVDAGTDGRGELSAIEVFLDSHEQKVLGVTLSSPSGFVRHRGGEDKIERLHARAKLTDENVQIDLLRLASPELAVTVRQARFELPIGSEYRGTFDVRAQLPKIAKWPLPFKLPHIEGDVRVQATLRSDENGPSGEAQISLRRVVVKQFGFGETVELRAKLDKKVLAYDGTATLIRSGGSVDVSGSMALVDGLPFTLRADIRDVQFAKLMEQLGVSANAIVDWKLAGSWDMSGTLDPFDISGPLRMPTRDFHVMRNAWHATPSRDVIAVASANLAGTITINDKGILLSNIDVGMRNSKLFVQEVLLGFDNQLRVRGASQSLDLVDLTPLVDFPISGKGGFDVVVSGEFQAPSVGGHVHFDDFAFATFPFGNISSSWSLEKDFQAVRFPSVVAIKNDSRYVANDFVIDFSDGKLAIDAALEVERLAMQDFYHVFHYEDDERYAPYQGTVRGQATIRYTMGFPGDSANGTMRADMDLDVGEAELSGFRFDRGHFTGSWNWTDHALGYKGGELDVERFSLQKGKGTINLSGKMVPGGTLDMVAVGDKISIRDTEGLSERLPELAGSFGITGTIKGRAAAPRVELELAATGLSYAGEPLGDARTYVRLTDKSDPWVNEALSWTENAPPADAPCARAREGFARGTWPPDPPMHTSSGLTPALDEPMAYLVCGQALDGRLLFDMAVGRTRAYPLRGDLRFAAFPFGKLLPKQGKERRAEGTLTGLLRLRGGALLTPSALAGETRLDLLEVGQSGVKLKNDGPVIASFDGGRFTIERASFVGPSSALSVRGGGSLGDGLGLDLSGSLDLGILPSFTREVREASGKVELDFKISGQLDHPGVFGQARVSNAALRMASFPYPVSAIDGRVTFSAQRMIFEGFSAQLLGGTLKLDGAAALNGRGIGNYNFEIGADKLALRPKEGVALVVGGQTTLAWKAGDRLPKLTGLLRLGSMHYTRSITMGRTLTDLTKKERADVEIYDPEKDLLALDLRVVQTEPMHIDNNFIDAQISIDDAKEPFKLVGTDQRFGVLGNMSIKRGTVRLRDRAFEVREGEITFASAVAIKPSFDVHAVTDVRRNAELGQTNWHIGVHAWGTPESFQFQLTSDPYLSEDDIALLLTVGMTHTELAQLQTSDLTGTAALEALATVTGVEREVQRALPAIDDVHIASSYSERSNRTEPQLHLGKRIADRVRLDASTGLSESRDFSTGVEYQISDKTSVGAVYNNQTSTSASQLGDVGVDLKWRLEFD